MPKGKKKIKVQDLKPKKDAKGGAHVFSPGGNKPLNNPGGNHPGFNKPLNNPGGN